MARMSQTPDESKPVTATGPASNPRPWIRPLSDVRSDDLAIAGGKGANLGELISAGLPVPAGFVVTTAAYDDFVEAVGIRARLLVAAEAVHVESGGQASDLDPAGQAKPADQASALGSVSQASSLLDAAEQAAATISALFHSSSLPEALAADISAAYLQLGEGRLLAVAVRSSATAEDLEGASFAGQQDTYLNVSGPEAVLDAVRRCWASLWTPRAILYRLREGIAASDVSLAVVVQHLVDADASGVMFTANPTNGRRDELVIAAAWGLGESVVGGTVTTDDVVVRHDPAVGPALTVVSRQRGDKRVRTVRTSSGTEEVEVPEGLRTRDVLSDADVVRLADAGVRIAEHYGRPMDIEWARAAGEFFIVQARPVTALPEPVGEVPTDWRVPHPTSFYVRASIVEQLPDPLTPLFGDLVGPAVTDSITKLIVTAMRSMVRAGDIGFPQVNGYAYYEYTRGAMMRMSVASVPLIATGKMTHPERLLAREYRPRYVRTIARWQAQPPSELSTVSLLAGADELLRAGCEYYTCVQRVIPVAATTETTFTGLYDKTMRRKGDPPAVAFLLGADSEPIRAERSLYELSQWCREHPELATVLAARTDAHALAFGPVPHSVDDSVWSQWTHRLDQHLARFGHAIYNLDFSNPVAADSPAPVLETLRYYLDGTLADPSERQRRLASERDEATRTLLARLDPLRRKAIGALLKRAQELAALREDALADVGLGWPLIRRLLAELGARLTAAGLISAPDDVYWLHEDEVRTASASLLSDPTAHLPSLDAEVAARRTTWRGQRLANPPQLLPHNRFNKLMERWMPSQSGNETGPVLKGLAASGGTVTAEACLVLGQSDFSSMAPGRILVAPITTPAYTPLFALAAGVVTDVGGPLSHSSIVAREYAIPAVLGTGVATQRIKSGQQITVDGTAGVVRLGEDDSAEGAEPEKPRRGWRRFRVLG